MSSKLSNKYKLLLMQKAIDFSNDTFKIILMGTGFTFDPANHDAYADVSASELATAYGYTAGGAALTGIVLAQDDVNNWAIASWANMVWTISGGDITACGAIIYDDTVAAPTANPIVGFIDFGSDIVTYDGGTMTVANPTVKTV